MCAVQDRVLGKIDEDREAVALVASETIKSARSSAATRRISALVLPISTRLLVRERPSRTMSASAVGASASAKSASICIGRQQRFAHRFDRHEFHHMQRDDVGIRVAPRCPDRRR